MHTGSTCKIVTNRGRSTCKTLTHRKSRTHKTEHTHTHTERERERERERAVHIRKSHTEGAVHGEIAHKKEYALRSSAQKCTHTYTCTDECKRTRIHTPVTYMHLYAHPVTYMHTHLHTIVCKLKHPHAPTSNPTRVCTQTRKPHIMAHAQTHAHVCTHTCKPRTSTRIQIHRYMQATHNGTRIKTHKQHTSTCIKTHKQHTSTCAKTRKQHTSTCIKTHKQHTSTCIKTHKQHTSTCIKTHKQHTSACIKIQRYTQATHTRRLGQNRTLTPYMTVYLVISLPKLPYIHCIYVYGSSQPYTCAY